MDIQYFWNIRYYHILSYIICLSFLSICWSNLCIMFFHIIKKHERMGLQNQKQEPHTKMWGPENCPPSRSYIIYIYIIYIIYYIIFQFFFGSPARSLGGSLWGFLEISPDIPGIPSMDSAWDLIFGDPWRWKISRDL